MSDSIKISLLSVFLTILAVFAFYKLFWGGRHVPDDFLQARIHGAAVAERIVTISADSLNGLQNISTLDKEGLYQEAMLAVSVELRRNKDARGEALKLSQYLDTMAKSISSIRPKDAQSLAAGAIGQEVSLINRLISYNEYLNQLLELLKGRFGGRIDDEKSRLQELLALINQETNAINDLNKSFQSAMEQFDALTLVKN
jgi:hypothetical protein